jgi:hypothetical protein
LTYDAELIPTLLPIHQFLTFNKSEIISRINCKVNSDTTDCNTIEQRRCEHIDNTTEAFDECMVNLSTLRGQNATQFCEDHYSHPDLWAKCGLNP